MLHDENADLCPDIDKSITSIYSDLNTSNHRRLSIIREEENSFITTAQESHLLGSTSSSQKVHSQFKTPNRAKSLPREFKAPQPMRGCGVRIEGLQFGSSQLKATVSGRIDKPIDQSLTTPLYLSWINAREKRSKSVGIVSESSSKSSTTTTRITGNYQPDKSSISSSKNTEYRKAYPQSFIARNGFFDKIGSTENTSNKPFFFAKKRSCFESRSTVKSMNSPILKIVNGDHDASHQVNYGY